MLKTASGYFSICKIKIFILFIAAFIPANASGQQKSPDSSSGFINSKTISLAVVSGIYAGSLIESYLIWWSDDRRSFTFMNSGWFNEYGEYGVDKLGHFFTSYFFYKVQKNIFQLGGYPDETSEIMSAALTFGMALIIEVGDGYSRYGFDTKDLLANTAGMGYAFLQERYPVLNNFNFKWSFIPTDGWHFPPRFSEHYDGQIYWLSVNAAKLFPSISGFWPSFLCPAVGYSIGNGGTLREFMAGLDIDLYSFFRSENKYIDFAGKTLNLLHFPMPGIKFYEHKLPEYKILLLN